MSPSTVVWESHASTWPLYALRYIANGLFTGFLVLLLVGFLIYFPGLFDQSLGLAIVFGILFIIIALRSGFILHEEVVQTFRKLRPRWMILGTLIGIILWLLYTYFCPLFFIYFLGIPLAAYLLGLPTRSGVLNLQTGTLTLSPATIQGTELLADQAEKEVKEYDIRGIRSFSSARIEKYVIFLLKYQRGYKTVSPPLIVVPSRKAPEIRNGLSYIKSRSWEGVEVPSHRPFMERAILAALGLSFLCIGGILYLYLDPMEFPAPFFLIVGIGVTFLIIAWSA